MGLFDYGQHHKGDVFVDPHVCFFYSSVSLTINKLLSRNYLHDFFPSNTASVVGLIKRGGCFISKKIGKRL